MPLEISFEGEPSGSATAADKGEDILRDYGSCRRVAANRFVLDPEADAISALLGLYAETCKQGITLIARISA